MAHTEELLNRDALDRNPVFAHERWQVRLENGQTAGREMIRHPGGVAIVVVDADDRLLMVRQYRSGMGQESLEIPAGKRDPGETPEDCGRRELEEECGLIAGGLDEFITAEWVPLARAEQMVLAGEIEDAKTQIAILKYTALRRKGEVHE